MATTLEIYYKNGDYDSFSSTVLPFSDGFLLENERVILNLETILEEGIIWERDFFATQEIDDMQNGKVINRMQIVTPQELEKVALISLNGQAYIASVDGKLTNIFFKEDNEKQKTKKEKTTKDEEELSSENENTNAIAIEEEFFVENENANENEEENFYESENPIETEE